MSEESKGPYSVKQVAGEWVVRGPSFRGGHLICGDEEAEEEAADWYSELNKAYAEGYKACRAEVRASMEGLREALRSVERSQAISNLDPLQPLTANLRCEACDRSSKIAREALAEDEND